LLRSKPDETPDVAVDLPWLKVIGKAFVVTWLNPQALLDGTMFLGAFRATLSGAEGWAFLIAVMASSFTWFLGLSIVLQLFQSRFTAKVIRVINIICGIVIIGYGVKLLVQFVWLVIE
jgi:L-lysine exporter family protein LysE/ArgO